MSLQTVTVCIPTYNQADFLRTSVESALGQDYLNCQVVVSDDCSIDSTPDVLDKLLQIHPNLTVHRHPENLGITGNSTWALKWGDSEYVARLDSDDLLSPNYLSSLIALLEKHPQAGYAHASVQEIDREGKPTRVRVLARKEEFLNAEDSLRAAVTGYRVAANICLFRRRALEEVGHYRTGMPFAEDWDLSIRLADAGWGNCYSPEILASYRVWEGPLRNRAKRKLDEIKGGLTVFDVALSEAFRRRGWDMTPITAARKKWLVNQASFLNEPGLDSDAKEAITQVLNAAGIGRDLRRGMFLSSIGLGSVLRSLGKTKHLVRQWVKGILIRRRTS